MQLKDILPSFNREYNNITVSIAQNLNNLNNFKHQNIQIEFRV